MQRVSLEIYTSALEAAAIINDVVDHKVELAIPAGSVLLDNILNLKIIQEQAKKIGKELDFVTDDEFGRNLINILRGERDEIIVGDALVNHGPVKAKAVSKFPVALKLPSIKFPIPRLPSIRRVGLVVPLVIVVAVVLGFFLLSRKHKAEITLYFSPQVLTKSVAVKVGDGLKTDVDKKVLAGLKIAGSVDYSLTIPATGTELEGDKATGKVTLYNLDSALVPITLKKGTQLTYKNKDSSYTFTTQSEVIVPERKDSINPVATTQGLLMFQSRRMQLGQRTT